MMASDPMPSKLHYVVYLPNGPRATSYSFTVPEGAEVQDLEQAVRDRWDIQQGLKDETVYLYNSGGLSIGTPGECYDRVTKWLRTEAAKGVQMEPSHRLKRYFPDGPAPKEEKQIDVIVVTDRILESADVLYALPDKHPLKIKKGRDALIDRMRDFPSPSVGVESEEEISRWAGEGSIVHLNWRTRNYGPPTALFNPALARLKHRLRHLDQIGESSPDHYMWSHKFIANDGWDGEFDRIINALIGVNDRGIVQLEGRTAMPYAVWGERFQAILELKYVDGIGGNATLQCLLDYAKILAQPKYKKYVERSNCPVILIGVMGTRLEISTAIFTDGIYGDMLLSEEFQIDAWQSETVLRVGRIFKALSLGITELGEYYETTDDGLNGQSTTAHLYPDPLPAAGEFRIPQLTYIGKLSHTGKLLHEENEKEVERERRYALYRAKMIHGEAGEEVDVVVKFTVRYNERAHRILAEEQLAPTLYFVIPLVGDMHMVIMDYIEGGPISLVPKPRDHEKIYRDMKAAIDVLHKQDLVFGDLCVENIMAKPGGGGMLIGFDWVGKHEVDRYPASWYYKTARAGGGMLMRKGDDLMMLEKLKAFL